MQPLCPSGDIAPGPRLQPPSFSFLGGQGGGEEGRPHCPHLCRSREKALCQWEGMQARCSRAPFRAPGTWTLRKIPGRRCRTTSSGAFAALGVGSFDRSSGSSATPNVSTTNTYRFVITAMGISAAGPGRWQALSWRPGSCRAVVMSPTPRMLGTAGTGAIMSSFPGGCRCPPSCRGGVRAAGAWVSLARHRLGLAPRWSACAGPAPAARLWPLPCLLCFSGPEVQSSCVVGPLGGCLSAGHFA